MKFKSKSKEVSILPIIALLFSIFALVFVLSNGANYKRTEVIKHGGGMATIDPAAFAELIENQNAPD